MPVTSRVATGGSSEPPEHEASAAATITIRAVRRIGPIVLVLSALQQADEIQNFGS